MRTELTFTWMVLFAAISSFSSSSCSLLNETGIEALGLEELINKINSNRDDTNEIHVGEFIIKKNLEIRAPAPAPGCDELLIAAFNIQIFGKSKLGKQKVRDVILEIIARYDVILIQEVFGGITNDLLNYLKQNRHTYTAIESDGFGGKKEQYLFLIRDGKGIGFNQNDKYQFRNTGSTIFQRPPFSIKLQCSSKFPFVLTAIHTKPKAALDEIDQLFEVHTAIVNHWNIQDILIMGDLNAGCPYLSGYGLKWDDMLDRLKIRTGKQFDWLIPDTAKTNVALTCPYDRFIMTGRGLKRKLVSGSAKVYKFDTLLPKGLPAKDVSDHYPIELKLTKLSLPLDNRNEARRG